MKNLNEMLQLATKLNKQDMKTISGGAVSSNCCAYNNDWRELGFICLNGGEVQVEQNIWQERRDGGHVIVRK